MKRGMLPALELPLATPSPNLSRPGTKLKSQYENMHEKKSIFYYEKKKVDFHSSSWRRENLK